MPQQRRKIPYSGKRKKEQLLSKRQTKGSQRFLKTYDSNDEDESTEDTVEVHRINAQPSSGRNKNSNRFNLQFYKESKEELALMRHEARLPLKSVEPAVKEIDNCYFDNFDFPIRPEWKYDMTKDELDRNENKYFREYVEKLNQVNKVLSLFELNLETWRQLWRVLEISDILLIIVDVRYATFMFPPSLHSYIRDVLKKHAILVLNKVDMVSPEVILAWKKYFNITYPGLPVVIFASFPSKRLKGSYKRAEGVHNIFKECQKIVQSQVDLTNWEHKIIEDMKDDFCQGDDQSSEQQRTHKENHDFNFEKHEMYKNGILTIGCIGFPNVGKSSLINGLKGKKVVSVSRTPGHTKHFQTIFLTENVKLCDCPGLVFPSSTPKHLQVLLGSYPIAQLREPYCSVKYLAERVDLPKLLKLELPSDFEEWSAIAVCEAWALKRGFLTAKACRPDHYRAANNLLRMCLAGQIILEFYPPSFISEHDQWKIHPDVEEIRKFQRDKEFAQESSSVCSSEQESDGDDSPESGSENESDDTIKPQKNSFALLSEN